MIIDCHYHLEPRVQTVENLLEKMDRNGIDKTALMSSLWDPIPSPPGYLLKMLRFLLWHQPLRGLAKKLSANFDKKGDIVLPAKTLKIYHDTDNTAVAELVDKHPDRFFGWIFVNPKGKNDQMQELLKWIDHPGFIGVKAHPFWHQYCAIKLLPIAEVAAEKGKPMIIHVGFDDHGEFLNLVKELPNLKLILAHAGFPGYSNTWRIIKNHNNVCVDLSAAAYVNEKMTQKAVEYLGVERCLFGTDGPYGHKAKDGFFDNGFIKRRIESLFKGDKERRMILGENFQQLVNV